MILIFVTGDTHGDVLYRCEKFKEQYPDAGKNDYLLICGDFGLIWGKNPPEFEWEEERLNKEKEQIEKIAEMPFTVLFVCGNHENYFRLNNGFPIVDFHGGKAHQISSNIFHLMRGEMFGIGDKKIFAFGGARSHDIWHLLDPKSKNYWDEVDELDRGGYFYRTIGESWWEDEIASKEEFIHGWETLNRNNWECDYIFSHEGPVQDTKLIANYSSGVMSKYLGMIKNATKFSRWYFGHYHINRDITPSSTCLYGNIEELKKGIHTPTEEFTKDMLQGIIKEAKKERKKVLSGKWVCD